MQSSMLLIDRNLLLIYDFIIKIDCMSKAEVELYVVVEM